ncbi:MAG: C25 family cysteine peptidase [Pyrinomonadaceae bacterium]
MKKTALSLLLVTLVFGSAIPSFAQSARSIQNAGVRAFTAEYERIDAFTDGQGVFLRWEMKTEINNVGFLVYRMGGAEPELVSRSLILSLSTTGSQRTLQGEIYEFYDPIGTLDSTYVIYNQFVNGSRVATDPITPKFTTDFQASTGYTKAEIEARARSKRGDLRSGSLSLPSELQSIVTGAILPPNLAVQREVVTQQSVKIAVKQEGMYRVTRAELQNADFNVNSDPTNWRLFTDGNEQAIIVGAGGQYIDFYGKTLDTRNTDTRTYFLIVDTVPGKRMITKVLGNIGGNVLSKNFRMVTEKKERVSRDPNIRNGAVENYFGQVIINNPAIIVPFSLTGIDPLGLDAVVTVKVQGKSNNGHAIRVFLNGNDIGTMTGLHQDNFSATFSIPPSYLVEGNNVLRLNTRFSSDNCYFDSVKVSYTRKYQADQNKALFFTPGYRRADITGFSSPNVRVFETTYDGNPQLINNLAIVQNGGSYTVRIPSNRQAVYYGVEDSALLQSPSITANAPSSLSTPNNLADVIIITYSDPDFITAAETWANYRRSAAGGNFTVKVVNITDVYDEFSYGAHSEIAIKDFLQYAKTNWENPKPHYVLLIGDGSYDPRNYEGRGYLDLVPTKSVELIYEETGSDEALADFDGNGLAEMAIGRIPVSVASDITKIFNKTTAFENPAMQSLNRGGTLTFDRPDGYDFEAMSGILADQLPAGMPKTFINRILPGARQNLLDSINSGRYFVNWSGHGSTGFWSSPDFFSKDDMPLLTNVNNQSIFVMLTCLNGFFLRPQTDSLGEALLKADGGAVVTWSSTTLTTPDYQMTMGLPFYREIGLGNIKRMGDLVITAKSTVINSDVGYSWVLLGDPALKVRE